MATLFRSEGGFADSCSRFDGMTEWRAESVNSLQFSAKGKQPFVGRTRAIPPARRRRIELTVYLFRRIQLRNRTGSGHAFGCE